MDDVTAVAHRVLNRLLEETTNNRQEWKRDALGEMGAFSTLLADGRKVTMAASGLCVQVQISRITPAYVDDRGTWHRPLTDTADAVVGRYSGVTRRLMSAARAQVQACERAAAEPRSVRVARERAQAATYAATWLTRG